MVESKDLSELNKEQHTFCLYPAAQKLSMRHATLICVDACLQACLVAGQREGNSLMQGRALWQLGRLEGHRGKYKQAATLKLDALQRLERILGTEHLDIAKCCTGESTDTLLALIG